MRGLVDVLKVGVKFQAQGGLVQNAAVGFLNGGNLIRAEIAGGGDGGLDEGELFAAGAGGGIIRGVFVAIGVGGFEGGKEADFAFGFFLGCGSDYEPASKGDYADFGK